MSTPTAVIEYLADDGEFVPELARMHFAEWSHLRPDETLADRTRRLGECCTRGGIPTAVIALNEGRLSGSAMLVVSDMMTRPGLGPWLAGVYVAPTMRRQGLGAQLIRRIEQEAAEQGVKTLFLYTPSTEELYVRLGGQFSSVVRIDGGLSR